MKYLIIIIIIIINKIIIMSNTGSSGTNVFMFGITRLIFTNKNLSNHAFIDD